ncbi:ribosomal N-lysine methyltransferase [Aspergillus uvarum CBS 121591]|uniref:Ribosomal N-lysine methyltransferase n=1 Tax=Aspergillus uvarum CBS 121591 TaxID=1448315 RepID=A0A319CPT4_9EURO|nr:ribosomal N-lysine methyltransferase [Aspergillus uvarum CBS 121591]PYH80763.1 ribosomal N-lysine methyltransferase [Aspergillus uvarum CBS 121591]
MRPTWWPGEQHEAFTEWALSQGIIINGVSPARFPGRGLGMIATRHVEKDEAIVTVPHEAMLTPSRIPTSFSSRFPDGTPTHALYAAYLTNGDPADLEPYTLWRRTWPTRADFEASMPILWPASFRHTTHSEPSPAAAASSRPKPNVPSKTVALLPPSISGQWTTIPTSPRAHDYETTHQNLLAQQEQRLRRDWDIVVSVFPNTDWDEFTYYWLIVNTRSFFYLMPGQESPEDRNDAMALLPFADYFNHSDVACNVNFDGHHYVFRAAKEYDEGDEIYMSYGPHPNDFLFTEYGFYLEENESETLYLDAIIFRDLSPKLQEELDFHQYLGNYQLTAGGVCYRTEIAAAITYMRPKDWQDHVLGYSSQSVDERRSAEVVRNWIGAYIEEADTAIRYLESVLPGESDQFHPEKVRTLLNRWRQIEQLCFQALDTISC